MILVDTSVWIDHLRTPDEWLAAVLRSKQVLSHSLVRGELMMGNRHGTRDELVELLKSFPQTTIAENEQVIQWGATSNLHGRGIGLVDAHLLLSTKLTIRVSLWSKDKRVVAVAQEFAIAYAGSLA